jgi:hypothetical protein
VNCRFRAKREAPFELPAGANEVIECMLEPINPGPFEAQLHVYLDDHGLRDIPLVVRGTAVSAGQLRPQELNTASGGSEPKERVP